MASLPALASVTDVEDRLGRDLFPTEESRVAGALKDASVVVRAYTRRDFTLGTTTGRFRPRGAKVRLPQRPVVSVDAVAVVVAFGTSEQITPLSYWRWVSGSEIDLGDQNLVINGPTLDWDDEEFWLEVTYQHGYVEVPDDVITVVANMALRILTVPGGGISDMQTVGPYTNRIASFASSGPLTLSGGDRDVLNRYRNTTAYTVELRG